MHPLPFCLMNMRVGDLSPLPGTFCTPFKVFRINPQVVDIDKAYRWTQGTKGDVHPIGVNPQSRNLANLGSLPDCVPAGSPITLGRRCDFQTTNCWVLDKYWASISNLEKIQRKMIQKLTYAVRFPNPPVWNSSSWLANGSKEKIPGRHDSSIIECMQELMPDEQCMIKSLIQASLGWMKTYKLPFVKKIGSG